MDYEYLKRRNELRKNLGFGAGYVFLVLGWLTNNEYVAMVGVLLWGWGVGYGWGLNDGKNEEEARR